MSELGHRVRAGLNDLERLEENVGGLTQRTCRIEETRPVLDRTVRDLQSLTATGEAIGTPWSNCAPPGRSLPIPVAGSREPAPGSGTRSANSARSRRMWRGSTACAPCWTTCGRKWNSSTRR